MRAQSYAGGTKWNTGFRRTLLILLGVAAVLALLFGPHLVSLYTDWLWFADAGYRGVFRTKLLTQISLALVVTVVMFVLVAANVWIARRLNPRPHLYLDDQHQFPLTLTELGMKGLTAVLLGMILIVSLMIGLAAARWWYDFLLFRHPVSVGTWDPIFHRDAGFYMFTLPFIGSIYQWLMVALFLSLLVSAVLYYVNRDLDFTRGMPRVAPHARAHLMALLAIGLLLKAGGYWLARYQLLFQQQGIFSGANYTDVNVRLPALTMLAVLAVVAAICVTAGIWLRYSRAPLIAAGTWLAASLVGGVLLPAVVQQVRVTPNELTAEKEYIANSIGATQAGYKLDNIRLQPFPASSDLKPADIRANMATIRSIRLWDNQPLTDAYQQIQTIRAYYTFANTDLDRYRLADGLRQVAVSVRELDSDNKSIPNTWINQHLIYTHGYGLCMSPIDRAAEGGLPQLIIQDIPPKTPPTLPLTTPQVYYGEKTGDYVIVDTQEEEFDRPGQGEQNVMTHYEGKSGVLLNNFVRRLAFALRFGEQNIMLSSRLNNHSRILFNRNVGERVQAIAPFLHVDSDPYPVVTNGRIIWIVDAYTSSRWYPYSHYQRWTEDPYTGGLLNYVRNSVKATVDAYDGTVRFYVADEQDPMIKSLQKAFPGMWRPLSKMPADLRAHIRYPMDLFKLQAQIYRRYHMTDPRAFYSREDLWEIPQLSQNQPAAPPPADPTAAIMAPQPQSDPMDPYYVVMKLPQGERPEYILMLPFTPTGGKPNMIAWMAARCDPDHLGEMVVYTFPRDLNVLGPAQINGLIDQNTSISEKLTLWSQHGSSVVRGPVTVIPIKDSLLYIEPLYLRASSTSSSQMTQLKQVIASYNGQVEMAPTLNDALLRFFPGGVDTSAGAPPADTEQPPAGVQAGAAAGAQPAGAQAGAAAGTQPAASGEAARLAREADDAYRKAQEAQRAGNWAAYGEQMKRLGETLAQLRKASGG